MKTSPTRRGLLVVAGLIGATLGAWALTALINRPRDAAITRPLPAPPGAAKFPVTFTPRTGAPRIVVGSHPISGEPLTASCTTCHATREPDASHGAGNLPKAFHQGLKFNHDHLACLACHDGKNYDQLHLASGQGVAFDSAMQLCAQCHSKQKEAFDHGAHGGMNGYWDLSRGPRTRHACMDCHDPHAPAFPHMQPSFKPHDRFLWDAPKHDAHDGSHDDAKAPAAGEHHE